MPFVTALGSIFSFFITGLGRKLFVYALVVSAIASFVAFLTWFVGFLLDTYQLIVSLFGQVSESVSSSDLSFLSCLFHNLGLDVFLTSAFSIFFTALSFWALAIANLTLYKMSLRVYKLLVNGV